MTPKTMLVAAALVSLVTHQAMADEGWEVYCETFVNKQPPNPNPANFPILWCQTPTDCANRTYVTLTTKSGMPYGVLRNFYVTTSNAGHGPWCGQPPTPPGQVPDYGTVTAHVMDLGPI